MKPFKAMLALQGVFTGETDWLECKNSDEKLNYAKVEEEELLQLMKTWTPYMEFKQWDRMKSGVRC